MPFLDGVPCSIHGMVLPDGTAALRPVEIAMLRDPATRSLRLRRPRHHVGPAGRRTATRCATPSAGSASTCARARLPRRVRHRRRAHRRRLPADRAQHPDVGRRDHRRPRSTGGSSPSSRPPWWPASTPGSRAADVEALVALMDAHRTGKVVAVAEGITVDGEDSYPVAWDGAAFAPRRRRHRQHASASATPRPASSPRSTRARAGARAAAGAGQRRPARVRRPRVRLRFGALEPAPDVRGERSA